MQTPPRREPRGGQKRGAGRSAARSRGNAEPGARPRLTAGLGLRRLLGSRRSCSSSRRRRAPSPSRTAAPPPSFISHPPIPPQPRASPPTSCLRLCRACTASHFLALPLLAARPSSCPRAPGSEDPRRFLSHLLFFSSARFPILSKCSRNT